MRSKERNYSTFEKPEVSCSSLPPALLSRRSWLSRLSQGWMFPLLQRGKQKQLEFADLWQLQPEMRAEFCHDKVFQDNLNPQKGLIQAYGLSFCWLGLLNAGTLGCDLLGPMILHKFVTLMSQPTVDMQEVALWLTVLVLSRVGRGLTSSHFYVETRMFMVKVSAALKNFVFRKALRLSNASRMAKDRGEIANIYTTDVKKITRLFFIGHSLIMLPLQIIAVLILLYGIVGYATLAGCAALLLFVFVQKWLADGESVCYDDVMDAKDERMTVIDELFNGIRLVKLNGWEEKFKAKIEKARSAETKAIWKLFFFLTLMVVSSSSIPILVSTSTLACYTVVMKQNLTAATAFTALAYFRLLQGPFFLLGNFITSLVEGRVSLKRFQEFAKMEEVPRYSINAMDCEMSNMEGNKEGIIIKDGTFTWTSNDDEPFFSELNVCIKQGEFVVIHGNTGSGKSALCSAMLGDLHKVSGTCHIHGEVAYCSQDDWIQNLSIRENILFGKMLNPEKYRQVLRACSLEEDLKNFPAGDLTEIGQKGVNLSGGQKARISLARACYSNADILIFDSSLSALDAIVKKKVIVNCLSTFLKGKTRILITHHEEIIHSGFVDHVIQVSDGIIVKDELLVNQFGVISKEFRTNDDNESEKLLPLLETKQANNSALVEEEESHNESISLSVYAAYFRAIGGLPVCLLIIFIEVCWQILLVSSDLWLSHWTNISNKDTSNLDAPSIYSPTYYLSVYVALAVSSVVFVFIIGLSVSYFGLKGSQNLFWKMTNSLLQAPLSFFDANPVGRQLNRYSDDIGSIDCDLSQQFGEFLAQLFYFLGALLTTIFATQTCLMILLLPMVVLFCWISSFFLKTSRQLERLLKISSSPLLSFVSETMDGVKTIRAFGYQTESRFIKQHEKVLNTYSSAWFASMCIEEWFSLIQQILSGILMALLGISLVLMHGVVSNGLVGLVFSYGLEMDDSLYEVVDLFIGIELGMVGPERVQEYIEIEAESPHIIRGTEPNSSWPNFGALTFDRVSFRYKRGDKLILRDISFTVSAGEKIGVVGRTGAGKTSLIMALFRIQELASGKITIDGVDISLLGLHTLRSRICIVTQEPSLFAGSVRTCLDPFGDYSDNELWESLRKVGLADKVSGMEDKLYSNVLANGDNFSFGERQILCLARAILINSKLVIMDEATSSIDYAADQKLQQIIRTEFYASTVLTIAHRLDTVMSCDRIILLANGKIEEFDTPTNLMKAEGRFFNLASEGGYL